MVVLPILLKQVVALLDACTELLCKGCVQPTLLQLRAAFEASVYIDWILASRQHNRAKAYYVWNVRRTLRWTLRAIKGTPEAKALRKDFKGLNIRSRVFNLENQRVWRKEVRKLRAHLASPVCRAWNDRFEKRRGTRLYDPDWYEVLFTRKRNVSFYEICRRVHRLAEYRLLYEIGSEAMHSSRSGTHVQMMGNNEFIILPLRELTEFGFVCQSVMGVVLRTYFRVLQEYRHEETTRFAQKYVEKWQKALQTEIKVTYEDQQVSHG
jgi:hypothetical protein